MARPRTFPPPIYHHVRSNRDRVRVNLAGGGTQTIDLGPHESEEARREYARILAELTANGGVLVPKDKTSVNVFCAAYLEWCAEYHAWDDRKRELARSKTALRPVVEIYGHVPLSEFGPVALAVCRDWFVKQDYPAALRVIAEGLALDKTGEYRERLLQKQAEVLGGLEVRHRQEYLLMLNLVSKYASTDKDKPPVERGVVAPPAERGASAG